MTRNLYISAFLGLCALLLTPVAHGQVDDVYENNDTVGQALASEFEFTDGETLLGLRQSDDDWYHLVVSPEEDNPPQIPPLPAASITLQVDCLFDQATAGNIDVEVYVRSRTAQDQGVQAQGLFSVFTLPLPGDTITIGTKNYTWQATATADGEIAIGATSVAARNNFVAAVNGDGINTAHPQVTAFPTAGNSAVITAIAVGALGNTIVTTETGFSTSFDGATLGNLRLGVDVAIVLVAIADSATSNEFITLPHMAPGEYFIRVNGPDTGGAYSLWWDYLQDDVYEENDSYQQARNATAIPEAVTLNSLRQVDEDWFKVEISESGNADLEVECSFVQATAGNIDVELYNSTGTSVVGAGYSATDNESVIVPSVQPGTYYIRVYAGGPDANIGGEYTLRWNDSGGFVDDIYEENDNGQEAAPVPELTTLSPLRQVDEDWFEITVSAGGGAVDLQVECTFSQATAGDINVEVYGGSAGATRLGIGNSLTDNETVTVSNVSPGTYYIRVYGEGLLSNVGGVYSLWWNDVGDFEDDDILPTPSTPPTPPDYSAEVAYYRSLGNYYYFYNTYYGNINQAEMYLRYYNGLAQYYSSLTSGDNYYSASYYLYLGYAGYYYYMFVGQGDSGSAERYYYYFLTLAYYYYFLGIEDYSTASSVFDQFVAAFSG